MKVFRPMPSNLKSQRGAVLIVGLIILLLATMMAVGALNNTNLQERMAANSQNVNRVFQTAESAVDSKINDINNGDYDMLSDAQEEHGKSTPAWPTDTFAMDDTSISTAIEVRYISEAIAEGSTLSADKSDQTQLNSGVYEIRANSSMTGSGAKTSIVQGFLYN